MGLKQTPSQTVGPFFAYGLTPEQYGYELDSIADGAVSDDRTAGTPIRIEGCVFDGRGDVVCDAMIEIWQADAQGRYAHPGDPRGSNADFTGFGRQGTGTDPQSRFRFETVKPGSTGDGNAPHVNLIVFARGLPSHAFTRIYFADEAAANATDPVLSQVPAERRDTLIAQLADSPGSAVYRFDIHLQGDAETVFFDV
ncbi:MAG: protocatechuate 3,4-dioxygenase subunit alpha [Minwuia sp.]|nr:protocatechuate 3,4-dioxygenase subunit alpha [Minwuia sp.]